MKEIALLGPTASGKSALAIDIAKKVGANILSLDSLSIYKEVDIVSAKPSKDELSQVRHFGIDEIYINEYFSAGSFFEIYQKAKKISLKEGKHLIITGGTGFYLKALIEGLSPKPTLDEQQKRSLKEVLSDIQTAYKKIEDIDPLYAKNISKSDTYRISKWHEIYISSGIGASQFYKIHTKKPLIENINIYEIEIDRKTLRERIELRTKQMLSNGLIDEVFYLEKKYSREPSPMKAIGIVETLEYLDGKISMSELQEKITTHTAQLAKRQQIFNRTQFSNIERNIKEVLENKLVSLF